MSFDLIRTRTQHVYSSILDSQFRTTHRFPKGTLVMEKSHAVLANKVALYSLGAWVFLQLIGLFVDPFGGGAKIMSVFVSLAGLTLLVSMIVSITLQVKLKNRGEAVIDTKRFVTNYAIGFAVYLLVFLLSTVVAFNKAQNYTDDMFESSSSVTSESTSDFTSFFGLDVDSAEEDDEAGVEVIRIAVEDSTGNAQCDILAMFDRGLGVQAEDYSNSQSEIRDQKEAYNCN